MSVTSDEKRVLEIDRYHVLLAPPRADLVALVEVAAQVAQVPLATINLITDTEQHQIATAGFDASICAREDSMCNLVLHEKEPVIVPDASQDPRFKDNPFVTGEIGDVRFYATHQLRTPGGIVIGTLCVFDTEPRDLGDDQEQALLTLADRVVDLLELELRTRELTSAVAELGAAHAELERSNQVLTAFAGQVAHDLRNPLSAVRMSLDLLQEQVESPDLDAETLAYVATRATSGAERMQSLIDDLLAYARVGGQMGRGEVDLEAVVADVRADLAVALEGAEVTVGPLPTVTGDEVQLRAVLQNLVANSAKFAAPGERARIEVCGTTTAHGWRLEVIDHGLGVPEADRGRVFLPLARAHETVEGHGIGLATVRRIIDAHHGRIGIDETPGGGATVWIELPR
ncbi:ATP-binding protein [Nocardioides marinus]|uniref:Sensor-like histidine kinase SenX3 n=1 Tax=Nocardioides marinus TaxID=374514 RepID=A0A7Z0C3V8_9ACTN|nr:ATP-binding protein [Nocardioides marinus]NYI10672.1 K+-sensing histidine kinase KdpD [Nocardioides marinus]